MRSPQLWLLQHRVRPREGANGLHVGLEGLAVWAWP